MLRGGITKYCGVANSLTCLLHTKQARVDQAVMTEEGLVMRRADITASGMRVQQTVIRR